MTAPLVVLVLAALVVGALAVRWSLRRARGILERWADGEGYTLRQVERRWMWRGPFWLRSTDDQAVFRVVVKDEAGDVRSGYVRVGGWFLGLFSDAVSVEWDD